MGKKAKAEQQKIREKPGIKQQSWCSHCRDVDLHFACSHILSRHTFLKYSTWSDLTEMALSLAGEQKKSNLLGFLFSSPTLFPASLSPSANSFFPSLPPLSPSLPPSLLSLYLCLLFFLTPGVLFSLDPPPFTLFIHVPVNH